MPAFDQCLRGPRGLVGGAFDRLRAVAEVAVEQQEGEPSGSGLNRGREVVGLQVVVAGQGSHHVLEGAGERLLSGFDLGVRCLIDAGFIKDREERAIGGGEPDVPRSHRGEPVTRITDVRKRGLHGREQGLVGTDSYGGHQLVAVREVRVGGAGRDAQAPARLRDGEVADAAFCDEFDGDVDQGRPKVTVVIATALARAWHGPQGRGFVGDQRPEPTRSKR
ncbi:MAG TPA: hypothetical protein VF506_02170 [Streptosporangiaceae bacterium]